MMATRQGHALLVTRIIAIVIVISKINLFRCQFIGHINAKGLRGNVTFDILEETDGKVLVIESIIEAVHLSGPSESVDGIQDPILFDWSLHSKTLHPDMLSTCSNEDLGLERLKSTLTENRLIAINNVNRWTIPYKDFLEANSATSLSSLIWGKSIRLKLSSIYNDKVQVQEQAVSQVEPTSGQTKPASIISRPRAGLVVPTASPSSAPSKPTFAAKPKLSITKHKIPLQSTPARRVTHFGITVRKPPSLPKPEALILETTKAPVAISSSTADTAPSPPLPPLSSSIESSPPPSSSTTLAPALNATATSAIDIIQEKMRKRILRTWGRTVFCANIIDTRDVKTAVAVFESPLIAGKVVMRSNEDDTTILMLNLYHIKSKVSTKHNWKILASDILDNRKPEEQCKYLQLLFDPNKVDDDSDCSKQNMTNCRMGDLTKKHGQVQVAGQGKANRVTLVDSNLPLSALEGSRAVFLVIYEVSSLSEPSLDNSSTERANILSCAKIDTVRPRKLEASINMDGVRGSIKISQRHCTEPTSISYDLFGLEGNINHQSIRELPLTVRSSSDNSKLCATLGDVFNPHKVIQSNNNGAIHPTTVDYYPVGNLSAKHGQLFVVDSEYEDHYMGDYMDLSIQLYGRHTIVGRSIVIHKNNGEPWVCATLDYVDEPINLAVATFYYPVVGRVTFQQLADDPHAETGVLVEVHNPNSEKESDGHNWMVHLKPAMADFYNWSQRCEDSDEVYDPIQASVGLNGDAYNRQCQQGLLNEPLRCKLGDLGSKSGLKLSLPTSHLNRTRLYYTDLFLPVSKLNSIVGRSVIIYDEHSPTQRGNRLACATIKMVHPLKASVKAWNSGPSIPSAVYGSVEFEQDSPTRSTRVRVDLRGLNGNVENYAVHNVWTMSDREFPCSNDSLYDIYDPYDNENSLRLPPSAYYGLTATVDRVKVGDMSRKHGTFEGLQTTEKSLIDANAPLFAPRSIVGRSLVLRAAVNDFRWVCGNIELDYDTRETRQVIGIASFDEPRSKVAGYVRFVQLEHQDGSLSDTYVQVDLKLQPDLVHGLQYSGAHNWAIFVNQVGEDAYITADSVRCIASGFKWNPFLVQDNLDSYPNTCTPSEPLACAMGDLGMRHGPLNLGPNNRRAISDSNLPLVGNYSVMGRSLVIFDNKSPSVKLACANIYPDIHLKSNVVIKRTPSFTVARFVEQMRSLLGAAEWLMVPELGATKSIANGECVQMTIHFYGRNAHQMQVELNNLINLGIVKKSTRVGVDKISTHYKLCRTVQSQLTSSASTSYLRTSLLYCLLSTTLTTTLLLITVLTTACSNGRVRV